MPLPVTPNPLALSRWTGVPPSASSQLSQLWQLPPTPRLPTAIPLASSPALSQTSLVSARRHHHAYPYALTVNCNCKRAPFSVLPWIDNSCCCFRLLALRWRGLRPADPCQVEPFQGEGLPRSCAPVSAAAQLPPMGCESGPNPTQHYPILLCRHPAGSCTRFPASDILPYHVLLHTHTQHISSIYVPSDTFSPYMVHTLTCFAACLRIVGTRITSMP